LKILIADDDPVSRGILEQTLRNIDYEVISVEDGEQALANLNVDNPPRLAILDWMMPKLDGVEICARIRQECKEPYIYLILLTTKNTREDIINGMEAGADDYLIKPVDLNELIVRLRAGRRIVELQEELIRTREEIRIMAARDSLTGAWNRGAILELLGKELARSHREQSSFGVMLVDLDHFKRINDTYGHPAGDHVLLELTDQMRASCRVYDFIGRYGGEEFLIIATGVEPDETEHQAERLRQKIEALPIYWEGKRISVTASIGVISACNQRGDLQADQLIRLADNALYRAKANGRNRVEVEDLVLD
jgi:two-component system cell cycle response regulator